MDEYIKREAAYYAFYTDDTLSGYEKAYCREIIKNVPAADVAPVRHGRWIETGYACGENEYQCSECKETEWRTSASRLKYCPFCGAKMDGWC